MTYPKEWHEGVNAYRWLMPIDSCQYDPDSDQFSHWINGYRWAQEND